MTCRAAILLITALSTLCVSPQLTFAAPKDKTKAKVTKKTFKAKDFKGLLCPDEKAPKIKGIFSGQFFKHKREEVVVVHSNCALARKSVKAHISWFYVRDGKPTRLSRTPLYRTISRCVQSDHHDLSHVYCFSQATSSKSQSFGAIRFYSSYRTALTELLTIPTKTKCRREQIINDTPGKFTTEGSLLTLQSKAVQCVKSGKRFKQKPIALVHKIEVSAGDHINRHDVKKKKDGLRIEARDHLVISNNRNRYRRRYRPSRSTTSQPRSQLLNKSTLVIGRGSGGMGFRGTGATTTTGFGRIGGLGKATTKSKRARVNTTITIAKPKDKIFQRSIRMKSRAFQYCLEKELIKLKPKRATTYTVAITATAGTKNKAGVMSLLNIKGKSKRANAKVVNCMTRVLKRVRLNNTDVKAKSPVEITIKLKAPPAK